MGTTGVATSVSTSLPDLLNRIRDVTSIPLAVGFGVATRDHFVEVGEHADGVVIGSRLVAILKSASGGTDGRVKAVREYCEEITGKKEGGIQRKEPLAIKGELPLPFSKGAR